MNNKVKEFIEDLGLSVEEFSKQYDVGYTTIYRIIKGTQIPKLDMAIKISSALGKRVEEVFPKE